LEYFLVTGSIFVCSEDVAQHRMDELSRILKNGDVTKDLHAAGLKVISCIVQRDEVNMPMRHTFVWSDEKLGYMEERLLQHVEPPLSALLELVC
jgi:acetyl-CoA carboxylase / biotin carboxylase 1